MKQEEVRRLDAEVAEKLFGDKFHPHTVSHDEQQFEQIDTCDLCGVPRYAHDSGISHYTTDPVASKALREKLALQWSVHVVHYSARQQYPDRRASCRLMLAGEVIASEEADSEELAVVLCALKSVGLPEAL